MKTIYVIGCVMRAMKADRLWLPEKTEKKGCYCPGGYFSFAEIRDNPTYQRLALEQFRVQGWLQD